MQRTPPSRARSGGKNGETWTKLTFFDRNGGGLSIYEELKIQMQSKKQKMRCKEDNTK
jgi:hypothetical protein